MIPNLKPEMGELIQNISQKNMYGGNKIPQSIMSLFKIIETDLNCGIEVPFWLGVLQHGRGPRKSSQSHDLWKRMYRWMESKSMFRSGTPKGKINEAKYVTYYINKYGNKQFRNKTYVDIYETARKETIKKIEDKFSKEIGKIVMDIL
jgi:hypothetical protein